MPENASLSGILDRIELEFVEREATPRLLMKLSIQLYLAGLSLSNTVSLFEVFNTLYVRLIVYNWVHKAELQPRDGCGLNHVVVNDTEIQFNNEHYWLYAVDDAVSLVDGTPYSRSVA